MVVVLALASDGAQFAQQVRALVVLQIGGDDLGALSRQYQRCASSDAVSGAGHQSDFSFDTPRHASVPFPACGHSAVLLSRGCDGTPAVAPISGNVSILCPLLLFKADSWRAFLVYRFQNGLGSCPDYAR